MLILKTILVILTMVGMVVILIGIGHLFSGTFETDSADINKLKNDVRNREEIISSASSFSKFLSSESQRKH